MIELTDAQTLFHQVPCGDGYTFGRLTFPFRMLFREGDDFLGRQRSVAVDHFDACLSDRVRQGSPAFFGVGVWVQG